MFAYSLIQNNKLKLYSLQPERFALPLSSLSSVFPLFSFFFFYGRFLSSHSSPRDSSCERDNRKMQDAEEMK